MFFSINKVIGLIINYFCSNVLPVKKMSGKAKILSKTIFLNVQNLSFKVDEMCVSWKGQVDVTFCTVNSDQ